MPTAIPSVRRVADTKTEKTTNNQLAILFKEDLGSGAYLYTQLNVPQGAPTLSTFAGTSRSLSRAPADLATPIPARGSQKVACEAKTLIFQDYPNVN